jgi:integrase
MIFVDAFTGLRRNEILALQHTDVDWTNQELVINKAVSNARVSDRVRKWEWRIGPPKSRKSNRRVATAEAVLELLRGLRAGAKDPSSVVFPGPGGKRMDPDDEVCLRPDGPLEYSGHLRHLRAPLSELTRNSGKEAATGDVHRQEKRVW